MRVGVIRGDLSGPIFLADLEPVSRYSPSIEPEGQELYISRPFANNIAAALAHPVRGAGAVLEGIAPVAFPLVINAGNQTLRLRSSAAPTAFQILLIPISAGYANMTDLVAAINTVLVGYTARPGVVADTIAIESDVKGVTSYIENDDVAGGSTANTPLALADGSVRTMPAATAYITACLPVGGPLDVSTATINGVGAGTNANALTLIPVGRGVATGIADAIAPRLVETTVALDSFLCGNMTDLLSANFNPDTRRRPALPNGAAIAVVEDDGVTAFSATLPVVVAAGLGVPGVGDVTIAGTGLGNLEKYETTIRFLGSANRVISQKVLEVAGGSVSDLAIVIPAALIPGAVITTTFVQVQVRQRVSAVVAVT